MGGKESSYKYVRQTLFRVYKMELGIPESLSFTMIYQADKNLGLDRQMLGSLLSR